jgi:hypothetical protein
LAAWLASITHVPALVNLTVAPLIVQAPDVEEAPIEKVTGLPEPPPVALTEYVPPAVALVGAVDVKVIAWGDGGVEEELMVTDC